ncbi:fecCD transport family protein [Glaesserella parasuis 12939]|nr:fecCD transport family protein [Glaesserella parasuis 12939]
MSIPLSSLSVSDVTVRYSNGHTAIHDVTFRLDSGTICALLGVNGSGKSTLFKSIMGLVQPKGKRITNSEFYQTLAISNLVALVILVKRRDFLLYCFDASHTRTVGFNIKVLHYSLLVLLALVIISAMQVVGVILVVAMLITPGITGYTLAKRFDRMLLIAIFTAVNSAFWGVFLSFHFDVATGPCIVLLQAVGFLGALGINKFRGAVLDND